MSQLTEIEQATPKILAAVDFNPGYRYADFDPKSDKMAEYGLAALVAGTATAAAVKLGFFKALWVAIRGKEVYRDRGGRDCGSNSEVVQAKANTGMINFEPPPWFRCVEFVASRLEGMHFPVSRTRFPLREELQRQNFRLSCFYCQPSLF